jgi:hypothetical protein
MIRSVPFLFSFASGLFSSRKVRVPRPPPGGHRDDANTDSVSQPESLGRGKLSDAGITARCVFSGSGTVHFHFDFSLWSVQARPALAAVGRAF